MSHVDAREARANGVMFIKHSMSGRQEDMSPGGSVSKFYGVDSEVGRLRTVLVHRPGAELRRVTPQRARGLLFAALPWALARRRAIPDDVARMRGAVHLAERTYTRS